MPQNEYDLVLQAVGKSYGPHQVLQPTDLHVRAGEFLTIVGPSGSGKTTLLRMIAGFTEASCGVIRFGSQDLTHTPTHKRPFNTVFQDYALFPHMTVAENVGYGPMIRGQPKNLIGKKVNDALEVVGLRQLIGRFPSQLSGGQKQRVALARALVCEPKVLLLDEPLSALDSELRGQMQEFLKDLQRRVDTTFILVTHDQEEAITMSDRIAVMSAGRIEQIGTHRDVYYAPKSKFVANFFGENNLIEGTLYPDGSVECPLGRVANVVAGGTARSPVTLSLRPEALQVSRTENAEGTGGRNKDHVNFRAVIRKVTFAGPLTRLVASPESDPTLDLKIKATSGQLLSSLQPNDLIELHFSSGDLAIVPSEEPRRGEAIPAQ